MAGQVRKDDLGDILDQVRVALDQPKRGGINQVQIARHQFSEG